jgi:hypothetical protein
MFKRSKYRMILHPSINLDAVKSISIDPDDIIIMFKDNTGIFYRRV